MRHHPRSTGTKFTKTHEILYSKRLAALSKRANRKVLEKAGVVVALISSNRVQKLSGARL
jgi:hypothetical protein